jgi:hypothetical protein
LNLIVGSLILPLKVTNGNAGIDRGNDGVDKKAGHGPEKVAAEDNQCMRGLENKRVIDAYREGAFPT